MTYVRKVNDDLRNAEEELAAISKQLDDWKIPKRSGIGQDRMTTLGRVRILRNQTVIVVAELRGELGRLKRLYEEDTGKKVA